MTTSAPRGTRFVPLSYRLYRAAFALAFVLVLMLVGLGSGGYGPVKVLGGPTGTAVAWAEKQMGITAHPAHRPAKRPAKTPVKRAAHRTKGSRP
jgi:hypothetical protein